MSFSKSPSKRSFLACFSQAVFHHGLKISGTSSSSATPSAVYSHHVGHRNVSAGAVAVVRRRGRASGSFRSRSERILRKYLFYYRDIHTHAYTILGISLFCFCLDGASMVAPYCFFFFYYSYSLFDPSACVCHT